MAETKLDQATNFGACVAEANSVNTYNSGPKSQTRGAPLKVTPDCEKLLKKNASLVRLSDVSGVTLAGITSLFENHHLLRSLSPAEINSISEPASGEWTKLTDSQKRVSLIKNILRQKPSLIKEFERDPQLKERLEQVLTGRKSAPGDNVFIDPAGGRTPEADKFLGTIKTEIEANKEHKK